MLHQSLIDALRADLCMLIDVETQAILNGTEKYAKHHGKRIAFLEILGFLESHEKNLKRNQSIETVEPFLLSRKELGEQNTVSIEV